MAEKIIRIKTDEEKPEPIELIAKAIIEIGQAAERMRKSKLSRRAIVVLLHDACRGRVGKPAIEDVLDSLDDLAKTYLK